MCNRNWLYLLILLFLAIGVQAWAAELVLVEKEIDDDHIIIARKNGERLLLEKWSLRFNPIVFEGKTFIAEVSPMWVTIYFENRDPIKWSIKENLGRIASPQSGRPIRPLQPSSKEVIFLAQVALSLLGFDPGALDGTDSPKATIAIKSFQKSEGLPETGKPEKATLIALATQLYRRYADNKQALDVAVALLNASSLPAEDSSGFDDTEVIESYIKGEFKGWDGDTIFILDNGQIWQQSSYAYTYHYAYHPKVIIYKTAGGYKMMVEGASGSIYVRRIK